MSFNGHKKQCKPSYSYENCPETQEFVIARPFYFLCTESQKLLKNYFCHGSAALVSLGPLIEASRSYSDTSHSVGLLRMSERPVTGTSA